MARLRNIEHDPSTLKLNNMIKAIFMSVQKLHRV
eukprot:CAMPEP_0185035930 /NCGR_PEP_ID=MMETSP1103-20130426/28108_1 /TAXON_ID=36769 /ORGANISM="Paraphysomonas bandaiensis, Strain Caron Lab Isolate" /LENGTH=33 /DNA_ID= /DNA_START= /DNA_END= /DNA_ORIENTATION=